MTDVWTSVGVVSGIAAVAITGWERLDPILALARRREHRRNRGRAHAEASQEACSTELCRPWNAARSRTCSSATRPWRPVSRPAHQASRSSGVRLGPLLDYRVSGRCSAAMTSPSGSRRTSVRSAPAQHGLHPPRAARGRFDGPRRTPSSTAAPRRGRAGTASLETEWARKAARQPDSPPESRRSGVVRKSMETPVGIAYTSSEGSCAARCLFLQRRRESMGATVCVAGLPRRARR